MKIIRIADRNFHFSVIEGLVRKSINCGVLPYWARAWLMFSGCVAPLLSGWLLRRQPMALQLSAMGCAAVLFQPAGLTICR